MSEVSKIVVTFFVIPEARWTAIKNVVFFSKQSTVIRFAVNDKILHDKNQKSACIVLASFALNHEIVSLFDKQP